MKNRTVFAIRRCTNTDSCCNVLPQKTYYVQALNRVSRQGTLLHIYYLKARLHGAIYRPDLLYCWYVIVGIWKRY